MAEENKSSNQVSSNDAENGDVGSDGVPDNAEALGAFKAEMEWMEELLESDEDMVEDGAPSQVPDILTRLIELTQKATAGELTFHEYFISFSMPNFVKAILKQRYEEEEQAAHASEFIRAVITLIVTKIKDGSIDQDLMKFLPRLFDHERTLYRLYGFPDGIPVDDSGATPEWRKSIGFSHWIDALYYDSVTKTKKWRRAQIVGEDPSNNRINLSYEGIANTRDVWVSIDTKDIAPLNAKTGMQDSWCQKLTVGSLVDCQDDRKIWYNSTVLAVREPEIKNDRDLMMAQLRGPDLLIAFRVYDPKGISEDEDGNKFFGWSKTYDEWINAKNSRLDKVNTRVSEKNSHVLEALVQDGDDPDDEGIFAVARPGEYGSEYLAAAINQFGKDGGFAAVLQNLRSDSPLSVTCLLPFVEAVANARCSFTRQFANTFISGLLDDLSHYLFNLPEKELRQLSPEILNKLLDSLKIAMKRIWCSSLCLRWMEQLYADIARVFLDCPFMERKLHSLRIIRDMVSNATRMLDALFNKKKMVEWLEETDYVAKVFKEHTQLIQRMPDILSFLCREKAFTKYHLEVIWESSIGQGEDRMINVYKVIQRLLFHFDGVLMEHLISKVVEMKPEDLVEGTVNLVKELIRTNTNHPPSMLRALDTLWVLAQEEGPYENKIKIKAEEMLVEAYRLFNLKPQRMAALIRSIDNISKGTSVIMSIRITKAILNLIPLCVSSTSTVTTKDFMSKQQAIEMLQSQHDILGVIVRELQAYMAQATAFFEEKQASQGSGLDFARMVVCGHENHISQVSVRLDLLNLLLCNSALALNYDFLEGLWDSLFRKSTTQHEKGELMNWMRRAAEGQASGRVTFDVGVSEQLFEKLVVAEAVNEDMTPIAFRLFRSFFLLVNVQAGHLTLGNSFQHGFQLSVPPGSLIGLSDLWRVSLEAKHFDVARNAISCLNQVHQSIAGSLDFEQVRRDYISDCMVRLKQSVEQSREASAIRILEVIETLLEESEAKGLAGLTSHSARMRGKRVTLQLSNSLGGGSAQSLGETLEVEMYTSLTVWEVRRRVGRTVKLAADKVQLTRSGRVLDDKTNSKTLGELKVRDKEIWKLSKRKACEQSKVELLTTDNRLLPQAQGIFSEWFYRFAPDGFMNREGAAALIGQCTGSTVQPYDPQISHYFTQYDANKDGKLELKDFLLLYQDTAKIMPHVVWSNLKAMGYRNDLRREDDDTTETLDDSKSATENKEKEGHPRYIISRSQEYFSQLFHAMLLGQKVAEKCWALLMRLPTNPEMLRDIRSLDKVKNPEPQWNLLLDSSSVYKLLYSLQIIESFVEPAVDENTSLTEDEMEERTAWRRRFLLYGGFQHLYQTLMTDGAFGENKKEEMSQVQQKCLALTLKVIRIFLLGALAVDMPQVLTAVNLVKQSSVSSKPMVPEDGSSSSPAQVPPETPVGELFDPDGPLPPAGFLDLTRQVSGKMSAILTNAVDFPSLQAKLVNLVRLAAACANHDCNQILVSGTHGEGGEGNRAHGGVYDDHPVNDVAEEALGLWVGCILTQPHLLQTFFYIMEDQIKDFTLEVIFCQSKMMRREMVHSLRQLCVRIQPGSLPKEVGGDWYGGMVIPRDFFLALLMENIPAVGDEARVECEQFFDLLTALVNDHVEIALKDVNPAEVKENVSDLRLSLIDGTFMTDIAKRLVEHPFLEKRGSNQEDKLLIGLMKLLITIISKVGPLRRPAGEILVDPLFSIFLFAEPRVATSLEESLVPAPPKCKTEASRSMAFHLLSAICKDCIDNSKMVLSNGLIPLKAKIEKVDKWDYSPSTLEKSRTGFVGIRNLGNICYMNSTLQQLFMCPSFRNGIFSCEDPAEDKEDSVLTQLQILFGHLIMSEKQAVNPRPLCKTIKDYDNQPIDVSIQQDAQSFLLTFRDTLEAAMKGTPQADLFKRTYCGTLVNQLIYNGEVRERDEEFTCISLEVKNMKGVYDALDKFLAKDTISGYNWDEKNPGVDIQKRNVLGKLPDSLIVHLNRFTMNMDTFMTEKLNSRFEFPMRLNLEPYTKEGRERREAHEATGEEASTDGKNIPGEYELHPQEYYEYELCGVQVHYGTANQGHYYSFIKERKTEESEGKDAWFEFNDALVRKWDIRDLEMDCFGGASSVSSDVWTRASSYQKDQISNAYLLFYDRVKPKLRAPETLDSEPKPSLGSAVVAMKAAGRFKGNLAKAEASKSLISNTVPSNVFQEVWYDNNSFLFDRQIYHPDFFNFVSSFLRSTRASLEMNGKMLEKFGRSCLDWGTSFVLDVIAHAFENESLPDVMTELRAMYSWDPAACADLLDGLRQNNMSVLKDLLFSCQDKLVRIQFQEFIVHLITILRTTESQQYLKEETITETTDGKEHTFLRPVSVTARFLDGLLAFLPQSAKAWMRIEQYVQIFEDIALLGSEECELLLSRRCIAKLADFFLRDKSPLMREGEKRIAMGNNMYYPKLSPLIRCVELLVKHVLGDEKEETEPRFSKADRKCLEAMDFYELAIDEEQEPSSVGVIMCLYFKGNENAALDLSCLLVRGIDNCTYAGVKYYMDVMKVWLALEDGFQEKRVEAIMGKPLDKDDSGLLWIMWDNRIRYDRWLYKIIQALSDMLLEIEPLGKYIAEITFEGTGNYYCDWILKFVTRNFLGLNHPSWVDTDEVSMVAKKLEDFERKYFGMSSIEKQRAVSRTPGGAFELHSNASKGVIVTVVEKFEEDEEKKEEETVDGKQKESKEDEGKDKESKDLDKEPVLVWIVRNNRLETIRFKLTMESLQDFPPNYTIPEGEVELELKGQSMKEVYQVKKIDSDKEWNVCPFQWMFELLDSATVDLEQVDPVKAMQRRQRTQSTGVTINTASAGYFMDDVSMIDGGYQADGIMWD